ncbi:hypothetical protein [Bacillus sp. SA1-12]|nr:hypothetical protein [Bacillus sp. SA1-12]
MYKEVDGEKAFNVMGMLKTSVLLAFGACSENRSTGNQQNDKECHT